MKFPAMMNRLTFVMSVFTSLALAEPVLMEGVAAVVDGKPIMRSEFLNALYRYQETPEGNAMSEADQRKYVLDQLIDEKVLLSRIDRDSIVVTDAEVDQRVNAHLSQLAASQNTNLATLEKAIRAQLGISMAQYRDQLAKQIRGHIEMSRVRQRHIGTITPTKKEVDAFFAEYKDSIPQQFNCVLLSHIQLPIEPNQAIVDSVKLIADSLNVVPVLKSATPNWDAVQLVNPEAQNEAVKAYLENAMSNADSPRFGEISADLNQGMMDALAGVASGMMTPEEGAAYLAEVYADQ